MLLDHHGRKLRASYSSGFEGATYTRRLGNWGLSSSGPDASQFSSLATLRARSRELVRNDPQIAGAIDTLVSSLIGTGLTPRWQIDDAGVKASLQEAWSDWSENCDHDGIADFYGLQSLVCRCLIEAGEAIVHLRSHRDGRVSIQVIEPDHLDEAFNSVANNGNEIRMGIEFNKAGQRIAYHLYKDHPGEAFLTNDSTTRVRIPASEILHIYRPLRAGQKRGRPWLSSIITTVREMGKYLDAEQVRKSTAAMFGGFITAPPGEEDSIPDIFGRDPEGEAQVIGLEPGTFPTLPPGMDVKFSEPADVGGSYEAFVKHSERRIARGVNLPYTSYSGDLADAKYTSLRGEQILFHRWCRQLIDNVLVHQFCRPVANYWLDMNVLSGALKLRNYTTNKRKYQRIDWIIEGFQLLDPSKEIQPQIDQIAAGLKSRTEVLAERGKNIERIDAEISEENARAKKLGLVFTDINPNPTNGSEDNE